MRTFLDYDLGPELRAIAGHLARLIAATWAAGYVTGELIHRINDELARLVSGRRAPRTIAAPPRPPVKPVAPAVPPRPPMNLEGLKVSQLRVMARAAGHRALARSGRRAQLLEVLA